MKKVSLKLECMAKKCILRIFTYLNQASFLQIQSTEGVCHVVFFFIKKNVTSWTTFKKEGKEKTIKPFLWLKTHWQGPF